MSSAMSAYGEKIFHYTHDYFTDYLFYFTYCGSDMYMYSPTGGGDKTGKSGYIGAEN